MSSSSSDEAPEEVTFNDAKLSTRLSEKKQKQAELEQRQLSKQKRRDRDQRLKDQQLTHKRKLLSEILKEAENDEEDSDETNEHETTSIEPKRPAPSKKKTFDERDGFRIQVMETPSPRVSKKKRLPPMGSDAVKRREQFLFRESVPRR